MNDQTADVTVVLALPRKLKIPSDLLTALPLSLPHAPTLLSVAKDSSLSAHPTRSGKRSAKRWLPP
ncbi:MAG: hypothetical protein H7240_06205 [Glaciimonas sp.]|nr:hypothetical protein [Glaciimonas sp.]